MRKKPLRTAAEVRMPPTPRRVMSVRQAGWRRPHTVMPTRAAATGAPMSSRKLCPYPGGYTVRRTLRKASSRVARTAHTIQGRTPAIARTALRGPGVRAMRVVGVARNCAVLRGGDVGACAEACTEMVFG